ncbi:hypothetical protein D9615_001744 [Tricholomella constricta]|uniref:Galactose-1-phosphate uridylyltransferase n=1 Tax=Tricholomella constricta TaxID=117010 RepID=A0A8H5HNS7_9AGAR|nr:hypothetical protein D9615_001744 [Tricholomella constricta]
MTEFDANTHPHRRLNPLTNEYVLVSPHRTKRPWLGQTEAPQVLDLPQHDPNCYLCPGNSRSGGQKNPVYDHIYTFVNDFAAVLPAPAPATPAAPHPMLTTTPVHGACDVLIFHPRHDLTLANLAISDIEQIITEWVRIYKQRGTQSGIKYVQIFEVWSLSEIPTLPSTELASLRRYSLFELPTPNAPRGPKGRSCLLCEYAHVEVGLPEHDSRVVVKNNHWAALVPWWATWPFEILLLPYQRHIPSIVHLADDERSALAEILSKITIRYDNLFSSSFAYSMGIHQRPVPDHDCHSADDDDEGNVAHLHLHFSPPLLRSASVKKFLVGFELMAEAQRDLTPEQAAGRLRACSERHYLRRE